MSHKGYFSPIIVIAILLVCAFISGCIDQTPENGDSNEPAFYTYENTEKGISIDYPITWTKYENPPQAPGVLVLFSSPSTEPTEIGSLMISVLIDEAFNMDWFKDAHIENLSLILEEFNLSYEGSTTLAGFQAYKLICTFKDDIYIYKRMEIWTIENNILYLLIYQVDQTFYSDYIDAVEQMIDSFKIIDNSEQGEGGNDDFDKLIGSWGEGAGGSISSITFYSDGTFSSDAFEENTGTFTMVNEKLILNYSTAGIDEFEYLFSNNDNTLTLTNLGSLANGETTVLTKQ